MPLGGTVSCPASVVLDTVFLRSVAALSVVLDNDRKSCGLLSEPEVHEDETLLSMSHELRHHAFLAETTEEPWNAALEDKRVEHAWLGANLLLRVTLRKLLLISPVGGATKSHIRPPLSAWTGGFALVLIPEG